MNQLTTEATVLSRTNYAEADKIVTLLTPDHGKLRLIAKGVRKPKSKLAGGIELFCTSQISFIPGRSGLATLTSSRTDQLFGKIVQDIERTMYGYEILKCIATITEDEAGKDYFDLLVTTLRALNTVDLPLAVTSTWFDLNVLNITGHQPNLHTDTQGNKLQRDQNYIFSYDDMSFIPSATGTHDARLIKLLRLAVAVNDPGLLNRVSDIAEMLPEAKNLANTMRKHTLRV